MLGSLLHGPHKENAITCVSLQRGVTVLFGAALMPCPLRHGAPLAGIENGCVCTLQAGDEQTASAVAKGLSKNRKQLSKPLRCELIIGKDKPPITKSAQAAPRARAKLIQPHQRKQLQLQQRHQGKGVYKLPASSTYDLWGDHMDEIDPRLDKHNSIPGAITNATNRPTKRRKQTVKAPVQAVEIDAAGCSYNPDVEHHQEALSQAVADEVQRLNRKESQARAVPRFVEYQPETDELALLQVDAEPDSDEEDTAPDAAAAVHSPMIQQQAAAAAACPAPEQQSAAGPMRIKRTVKDQGSAKRRRLQEEEDRQRRALKAQRRDTDNSKNISQQLQEEEAARYLFCCNARSTSGRGADPMLTSHCTGHCNLSIA